MKFKSVCKFKIVCEDLQTVMVPLPDCASGEWGPAKATRLFGLVPVTHEDALVFAHSNNLDITFRMTRPLTDFMATLHKNGTEEKKLSKYVSHRIQGDFVTLTVVFPEEGQYGMDIYTREVSNSNGNGNGRNVHAPCGDQKRTTRPERTRKYQKCICMSVQEMQRHLTDQAQFLVNVVVRKETQVILVLKCCILSGNCRNASSSRSTLTSI
mgnify:CR=1 FL=1